MADYLESVQNGTTSVEPASLSLSEVVTGMSEEQRLSVVSSVLGWISGRALDATPTGERGSSEFYTHVGRVLRQCYESGGTDNVRFDVDRDASDEATPGLPGNVRKLYVRAPISGAINEDGSPANRAEIFIQAAPEIGLADMTITSDAIGAPVVIRDIPLGTIGPEPLAWAVETGANSRPQIAAPASGAGLFVDSRLA